MTEAKSPREIAEHRERLEIHLKWLRGFPDTAIGQKTADAIESVLSYAAEQEREVKRLTGVLGHVREHLLRDEEFDADELDRDIKGSVDLNEFDRFQQRAEKAESLLAEADAVIVTDRWMNGGKAGERHPCEGWGNHTRWYEKAITRHKSRLSSRPATEGKGDD